MLLRQRGIAPLAQQALLRDEQCSLPVRMDRTALQNKRMRVVTTQSEITAKGGSERVVLAIIGIKSVMIPAPGIELPVDAANFLSVRHECRAGIPRPCVVDGYIKENDAAARDLLAQSYPRRIVVGNYIDTLALGDRLDYFGKSAASTLGVFPPRTGARRPDHQAAVVRGKFRRHRKTVLPRQCMQFHIMITCF